MATPHLTVIDSPRGFAGSKAATPHYGRDTNRADISSALRGVTFGFLICVPIWAAVGIAAYLVV